MKKMFFALLVLFVSFSVQAQQRYKIAFFTPLYLDSAFDANGAYRHNVNFPKHLNPGLEFYMGAQAALDSLNKVGAPLEVIVFDSKQAARNMAQQVASPEMENVSLIIGQSNAQETRVLADAALRQKIPFISATLPNDAGITNNPYYVVLNTTLRTHCEGIYKYLQKYNSLDKIVLFTKPGAQEAQLKDYFINFGKTTAGVPLKIQVQEVGANITAPAMAALLDSNRRNICIAGSLDPSFGAKLAQQLTLLRKTYPVTLVGMPTWDALDYSKPEFKNIETIYTTPFYYAHQNALATSLTNSFVANQAGKPTDMFYRGYETMLRFALLLLDTKTDMASNLSRKGNNVFTGFDIQPVFLNPKTPTLDYFENKRLYFVKVANGVRNATAQ